MIAENRAGWRRRLLLLLLFFHAFALAAQEPELPDEPFDNAQSYTFVTSTYLIEVNNDGYVPNAKKRGVELGKG